MVLFAASPAQKPRPCRKLGAERSRNGWKQGIATASLPSAGGETSLASELHGEESSSVYKAAVLSPLEEG